MGRRSWRQLLATSLSFLLTYNFYCLGFKFKFFKMSTPSFQLMRCQLDAYEKIGNSKVLSCVQTVQDDGTMDGTFTAILDDSVLYAEGGGQPCDLGTISGIEVIKVLKCDPSESTGETSVKVVLPRALNIDSEVECVVDWSRRYDHMQQHTSQVSIFCFSLLLVMSQRTCLPLSAPPQCCCIQRIRS